MFTRREKQNFLYLGVGVVIGIAITSLVAYFSVISRFTKDNIVKIYNVLPSADTTQTVAEQTISHKKEPFVSNSNQSLSDTSVNKETETVAKKDSMPNENFIAIKTDVKIAEAVISIAYFVRDTTGETKSLASKKGELQVEQWDNPTNFAGYRKTQNKLIVYGIDIDNIELESVDDNLYLIFNNKKLLLKDSDSFLRYPSGFLK
jgi:hypothetical protein